ncbi:MAG: BLUF domain-containing protein [Verrucomicrobiota bacterium]|nr:BLUF domain-containing protein [Verrucomicrobiota bacterium]
MRLYSLIYVSIATGEFSENELTDILAISRANNSRDDITGMLLYKDRRFMQLLEGPETAVCAAYARIARDLRHRDAAILLEGPAAERDFTDWSMGFHALDGEAARALPGFSPFLEATFSVFDFRSDPSRAHQLLRVFRRM